MLFMFIRVLTALFPFIKEMMLSVDRGNYARISLLLTILLIMAISSNFIEAKVIISISKQNRELKHELEEARRQSCDAKKQDSNLLLTQMTTELQRCLLLKQNK